MIPTLLLCVYILRCNSFGLSPQSSLFRALKGDFRVATANGQAFPLKSSQDANNDVGGIYEYVSDDGSPPPELAALFGLKSPAKKAPPKALSASPNQPERVVKVYKPKKPHAKKSLFKNEKQRRLERRARKEEKGLKTKGGTKQPLEQTMDRLELELLSKYGANEYKSALEDELEEEHNRKRAKEGLSMVGGFMNSSPPFEGKGKQSYSEDPKDIEEKFYKGSMTMMAPSKRKEAVKSKSSRYDVEEVLEEEEVDFGIGFADEEQSVASWLGETVGDQMSLQSKNRASDNLDIDDTYNEEGERGGEEDEDRFGPLNAPRGFRLRKPLPPTAEEQARIDAKNKSLCEKEELAAERRKQKRLADKNLYEAFDMADNLSFTAVADASGVGGESIFATRTWEELGVTDENVLKNLKKMKVFQPTKIQDLALPALCAGKDVLLQAQTGSGKTLAFLLPLLSVIDTGSRRVQAVILAPSRELTMQIGAVAEQLFKGTDLRVETIIGGANVKGQVDRLRSQQPQLVVATPGRLAELVFHLEKLRLGAVRAVVIDEVDNLLKEPYVGEIEILMEAMPAFINREDNQGWNAMHIGQDEQPSQRFLCLASATAKEEALQSFARKFSVQQGGLERVRVDSAGQLPAGITHALISTPRIRALDMLKKVLNAQPAVQRALIFVNDPHRVEVVCEQLFEKGIVSAPLHGESSKEDRKEIIARLRNGRLALVVTTELAARGLDVPELSHVINFELPTDSVHYVHRAGRCGRAGRAGLVVNFASPSTKHVVRRFGKRLGTKVRDCEIREGRIHLKQR